MKPLLSELLALSPGIPETSAAEHLARMDESYFEVFAADEIARHVKSLSALSSERPVDVAVEQLSDNTVFCTVVAFDYPGEFALITGVLASMGFDIVSGDVFTYAQSPLTQPFPPSSRRRHAAALNPSIHHGRRKILDRFVGVRQSTIRLEAWRDEVEQRLLQVLGMLESGVVDAPSSAKRLVNELVARRLSALQTTRLPALYPVELEVDNTGERTRLVVRSQDTPAFLYALSGALSLQGLLIERVIIRTTAGRIEDTIEIADALGEKIEDQAYIDRLKLSVLMTKQFTYFLGSAPDPYAALCRFEELLMHALRGPERGQWLELFANPDRLHELARLLGASDYLWEDFIRLQYEALLPLLLPSPDTAGRSRSAPVLLNKALSEALASVDPSLKEQAAALNTFKDREIFRVDLEHILAPDADATSLAEPLTSLAEVVVNKAITLLYRDLVARHGVPRTVAGLEVEWALFGLGKFGGVAMGYASDIELLFVFSDNGQTDGPERLDNLEFFDCLMRRVPEIVKAPREGIFRVDLRLRPFGNSGPAACSLAGFCRYYGPGGQAHSYERLSLVRLRAVGGSPVLGTRVERLRDEFIYSGNGINLKELWELRQKQFHDKTEPGSNNAKFSPGSLVDLEYAVQVLQVTHGRGARALRTPRIHKALKALSTLGLIRSEEFQRITDAYYFLRRLINGLRLLRGSARDLFLPPQRSLEFAHLARRMGYARNGELEPEQQLHLDFEAHTAHVRAFIERQFGRDSLPLPESGNIADLIFSKSLSNDARRKILTDAGFQDPARANTNLLVLFGRETDRCDFFARLAILACDFLRDSPDPDMALNNWERFVQALPDAAGHYERLLSQPKRLELLLAIFGASQFLADTLIRNPDFFNWATDASILQSARSRNDILKDMASWVGADAAEADYLRAINRFRRREFLRIGARDVCLLAPMPDVTADLSNMAEAAIRFCLDRALNGHRPDGFCILAFGKLGGLELNYSSDIDLVGVFTRSDLDAGEPHENLAEFWDRIMRRTCLALSAHTEEGHAYRVDLRLRPYGSAGALVSTLAGLIEYYRNKAALWEIQALLKARPVAGDLTVGELFLADARKILLLPRPFDAISDSIERMREAAIQSDQSIRSSFMNVKTGRGGIRDVEFLVQGLQLMHAPKHPNLSVGNTFAALDQLGAAGLLKAEALMELKEDYMLLRRVEHFLQIYDDRQVHHLPGSIPELTALGKRVFGPRVSADEFLARLNECLERVHARYQAGLAG